MAIINIKQNGSPKDDATALQWSHNENGILSFWEPSVSEMTANGHRCFSSC